MKPVNNTVSETSLSRYCPGERQPLLSGRSPATPNAEQTAFYDVCLTKNGSTVVRDPSTEVIKLPNFQITTLLSDLSLLQKLRELYLSENKIETLPEVLSTLEALDVLVLNNNRITEIPPENLPPNLRVLSAQKNRITCVAHAAVFKNFQILALSGNSCFPLNQGFYSLPELWEDNEQNAPLV